MRILVVDDDERLRGKIPAEKFAQMNAAEIKKQVPGNPYAMLVSLTITFTFVMSAVEHYICIKFSNNGVQHQSSYDFAGITSKLNGCSAGGPCYTDTMQMYGWLVDLSLSVPRSFLVRRSLPFLSSWGFAYSCGPGEDAHTWADRYNCKSSPWERGAEGGGEESENKSRPLPRCLWWSAEGYSARHFQSLGWGWHREQEEETEGSGCKNSDALAGAKTPMPLLQHATSIEELKTCGYDGKGLELNNVWILWGCGSQQVQIAGVRLTD